MAKLGKSPQKKLKKQLDDLWFEIIKLRAGYKSELSGILGKNAGGTEIITAHHIAGKSNNRLRYELENGICLINGKEHIFGVHNHNPSIANYYQKAIINYIGEERWNRLQDLQIYKGKTDLKLILISLQQELEKLKNNS